MGRVSGKVIIVTGAARGMGAAFAKRLVEEGAKVVLTDILENEGGLVAKELGQNAHFFKHDVTKESEWLSVIKQTEDIFGPVTVLINNAAILSQHPTESLDEGQYRKLIDVNQLSVFLGMKNIVPSMKKAGGGVIINMSSLAGLVGTPETLAYTASKFAVRGMTKVAALEFAPHNIRVNSIHPGMIRTPMTVPTDEIKDLLHTLVSGTPARRLGEPEEVANIVVMLASDEVKFATGAEFVIDGGLSCQ